MVFSGDPARKGEIMVPMTILFIVEITCIIGAFIGGLIRFLWVVFHA